MFDRSIGFVVLLAGCLLAGCQAQTNGADVPVDRSPLETVNLRMRAYNDHDLTALLGTYAENVEVFTYPDRSLGKGKAHLKGVIEDLFEDDALRVTVHHQIAKDGYVINHETVTSADGETEYVSIYEVRDGLIRSVRFVRD